MTSSRTWRTGARRSPRSTRRGPHDLVAAGRRRVLHGRDAGRARVVLGGGAGRPRVGAGEAGAEGRADAPAGGALVPRLEPVHFPEDRRVRDRASMTMLKHYALCQRSGYLYQLFKGEASTPAMQRGKAGHLAVERAIRAAVEQGEPMIPGDLVKVIAN